MRTLPKLLAAGAAIALGAGAVAAADRAHVVDVAMPDGSIARVHYVGDVAPQLVMMPAAPIDPFAMFDQISAAMDRQMAGMMQQAALLAQAAPAAGFGQTARGALPPGTVSYSYTSYSSGDGAGCSQSVQVTALGQGQAPKVIRQSSGDCTAMNSRGAIPAVQSAPAPAAPAPIKVSYPAEPARKPAKTVI